MPRTCTDTKTELVEQHANGRTDTSWIQSAQSIMFHPCGIAMEICRFLHLMCLIDIFRLESGIDGYMVATAEQDSWCLRGGGSASVFPVSAGRQVASHVLQEASSTETLSSHQRSTVQTQPWEKREAESSMHGAKLLGTQSKSPKSAGPHCQW